MKNLFMIVLLLFFVSSCSANNKGKRFNQLASEPESKSSEVIDALEIQPSMKIVDLGSGGGYFTLEFAKKLDSNGKVYAVDIDKNLLEYVQEQVSKSNLKNVETILVEENKAISLPKGDIDIIFCRNVYHHLKDRSNYFKNFSIFLKPDGKLVIIDYVPKNSSSFTDVFKHNTPKKVILEELQNAGYALNKELNFLPKQSFQIFQKK